MNDSKLKSLFESYGGVMKTSDLHDNGFFYRTITKLINEGKIEQIRRGYYLYCDENTFSDVIIINNLFPEGVICMESALDYYGYTERTPSAWHIAVINKIRRDRFKIDFIAVKPHYVTQEKFPIGISNGVIEGIKVNIYDRERTICDCLLHKNKMDPEVYNSAIKHYLIDPKKNIARLSEYAPILHVEKKVREVIGIWL